MKKYKVELDIVAECEGFDQKFMERKIRFRLNNFLDGMSTKYEYVRIKEIKK